MGSPFVRPDIDGVYDARWCDVCADWFRGCLLVPDYELGIYRHPEDVPSPS